MALQKRQAVSMAVHFNKNPAAEKQVFEGQNLVKEATWKYGVLHTEHHRVFIQMENRYIRQHKIAKNGFQNGNNWWFNSSMYSQWAGEQ